MTHETYQSDREFLAQHTDLVELCDDAGARVAVAPGYQARVMTSTLSGSEGPSFGWINRAFIASGEDNPVFNNYGGEERLWFGPEAGQFGFWFRAGDRFTLSDFKTPKPFNYGAFDVAAASRQAVTMTRRFSLTNYSGTTFECDLRRTIRLLDAERAAESLGAPLSGSLRWVGFESVNALTNAGTAPWRRESGLPCIWILGMFKPLAHGQVIVPFIPGEDALLGPRVAHYFGQVPPERLHVADDHATFACDGMYRSKIGISPRRARNSLGAWDPDTKILTLATFNLPGGAHRLPYANGQWEIQKDPYGGDVVNSYNDGRDPCTGALMGPFFELESSSPAAELCPGETIVHVHRTYHFTGEMAALGALSRAVLGVDLY
jgi:hypothetical protein